MKKEKYNQNYLQPAHFGNIPKSSSHPWTSVFRIKPHHLQAPLPEHRILPYRAGPLCTYKGLSGYDAKVFENTRSQVQTTQLYGKPTAHPYTERNAIVEIMQINVMITFCMHYV